MVNDWDDQPPLEQARLLRFILESVEYDGRSEQVTLTLTAEAENHLAGHEDRTNKESRACVDSQDCLVTGENPSCRLSSLSPA